MTNPILLLNPTTAFGKAPFVNMQTMSHCRTPTPKSADQPPVRETSDGEQVLSISMGWVKSPVQCHAFEVTGQKCTLMSFLLPFNKRHLQVSTAADTYSARLCVKISTQLWPPSRGCILKTCSKKFGKSGQVLQPAGKPVMIPQNLLPKVNLQRVLA